MQRAPIWRQRISAAGPGRLSARLRMRTPSSGCRAGAALAFWVRLMPPCYRGELMSFASLWTACLGIRVLADARGRLQLLGCGEVGGGASHARAPVPARAGARPGGLDSNADLCLPSTYTTGDCREMDYPLACAC